MTTSLTTQFTAQIANGQFDDDLDELAFVIRSRQQELSSQTARQLRPGTRVRVKNLSTVRPSYLPGSTGAIADPAKANGGKINVVLDPGQRAAARGDQWRLTVSSLEIVEEAPIPTDKFAPGARVRVRSDLRVSPSYLAGVTGQIIEPRGSKWVVKVDAGTRAAARGDEWRLPQNILELV